MLEKAYSYDHVTPTSFTDQTESLLIYGWYNGSSLGTVLDRWFGISTEPPETFTEDSMNIYWEHEDNTEKLPYYAGDWPAFRWYLGAYQAEIRRMVGSSISKNVYFYTKVLRRKDLVESYVYFYCVLNASIADRSTAPKITATSFEIGDYLTQYLANNDTIIKGETKLDIIFSAKAHSGRTLTSYEIRNGNKISRNSLQQNEVIDFRDSFFNCEATTFYITVTDNYGYSTNSFVQVSTLINYYPPTCNISSQNTSATGGATGIAVNGAAFTGSFGKSSNTINAYCRYKLKEENAQWSGWQSMTVTLGNNTFTATTNLTGLDYRSTYIVEGKVTDKFHTVTSSQIEVLTQPMFDWSETDFNFNIPVAIQGNLDVNGTVNMNEETVLRHTGAITNNTVLSASGGHIYIRPGGTNVTSGEIRITPQGDIVLSGDADITIGGYSLLEMLQWYKDITP